MKTKKLNQIKPNKTDYVLAAVETQIGKEAVVAESRFRLQAEAYAYAQLRRDRAVNRTQIRRFAFTTRRAMDSRGTCVRATAAHAPGRCWMVRRGRRLALLYRGGRQTLS
jgi:hypothetical protein